MLRRQRPSWNGDLGVTQLFTVPSATLILSPHLSLRTFVLCLGAEFREGPHLSLSWELAVWRDPACVPGVHQVYHLGMKVLVLWVCRGVPDLDLNVKFDF